MPYKKAVYLLHITIPVLIAVISIFIISDFVSKPEYSKGVVASIEKEKEDVLKLAASSTAVSVAITALPGDMATPIADTLADLSKGFTIVLCALYFEKFLIVVVGVIVFKWLIPIACMIYIVGFFAKNKSIKQFSLKIVCFAVALFLIVPIGNEISASIQKKYGETMNQVIESANSSASLMEESIEENNADEDTGNGLGRILKNLQQAGDTIARGTSQFMKYLEKLVNRFIEAIAIMIVTSCLIPIVEIFGLLWIGKMIFLTDSNRYLKFMDMDTTKEKFIKGKKDEKTNL